jgi:hypothetical protein
MRSVVGSVSVTSTRLVERAAVPLFARIPVWSPRPPARNGMAARGICSGKGAVAGVDLDDKETLRAEAKAAKHKCTCCPGGQHRSTGSKKQSGEEQQTNSPAGVFGARSGGPRTRRRGDPSRTPHVTARTRTERSRLMEESDLGCGLVLLLLYLRPRPFV